MNIRAIKNKKKYGALSLIEMLLTMIIISTVMLLCGIVLNSLIRVSAVSAARSLARNETESTLEYLSKSLKNSQTSDILIYSPTGRRYDLAADKVVAVGTVGGFVEPLDATVSGKEIHFRPIGSQGWVCLGWFAGKSDPNTGYILKTSASELVDHKDCFDNTRSDYAANTIVLNSDVIDVDSFVLTYNPTYNSNFIITVDLTMQPLNWVDDNKSGLKPRYFRQAVISTQKLSWE